MIRVFLSFDIVAWYASLLYWPDDGSDVSVGKRHFTEKKNKTVMVNVCYCINSTSCLIHTACNKMLAEASAHNLCKGSYYMNVCKCWKNRFLVHPSFDISRKTDERFLKFWIFSLLFWIWVFCVPLLTWCFVTIKKCVFAACIHSHKKSFWRR